MRRQGSAARWYRNLRRLQRPRASRLPPRVLYTVPTLQGMSRCRAPDRETLFVLRGPGHRALTVRIPAGVDDGMQLRLGGEGEAGHGAGHAGDLYVVLHVREHPIFTREGRDLRCEAKVSFSQVALGSDLEIPTLDGIHTLHVPSGTESGSSFRIKGKGATSVGAKGTGDLYVQIRAVTPKKLNAEQRQLLQALAEHDDLEADEPNLFERVRDIFS